MIEQLNNVIKDTEATMAKAVDHLSSELAKIRAGKANPSMLDSVFVDYYGTSTALAQIGNISTPDPRSLVIQPWEKPLLGAIEKAIVNANLGFTPQNDGNIIRINIPPLTEERRNQLVKMSKQEAEQGKVAIRNIRKDMMESIKKLVKDGLAEDEGKNGETKVQEQTDKYIRKIDEILVAKEKEIMTV